MRANGADNQTGPSTTTDTEVAEAVMVAMSPDDGVEPLQSSAAAKWGFPAEGMSSSRRSRFVRPDSRNLIAPSSHSTLRRGPG